MEKHGDAGDIQGPGTSQVQQQQQQTTQGTMICWERFLHVRSIRVLLVEFDDCTRHVVTALLRNCNYEVLDAANGVQAWKILEDLANHIDIVLTEVVMPFLSGLGLLHKIMSHKTRKNIPVIMMSSHDSMGLVFKCLSKGAVDFLVKPIRKNELKNLWQHVWRRCQSSSGSGSGSGTQTQKSVKSRGSERSGNSSSSGGENDGNNGPNTGDGSDNGSGTQSYWTKQAAEVDSSQAVSPMDHVTESPDSACAQVIRSNAESSEKAKIKANAAREGSGQNQPDTIAARSVQFRSEDHVGCQLIATARESDSTADMTNRINTRHNTNDDCKEPNLELSLKRPRGVLDTDRTDQEDRFVLRRSEQSAFSRYNTCTNVFKAPNGGTGSSSMVDNNVEAAKRESLMKLELDASHCGSTNVVGQMDRDPRNNSMNKSASGSNYGSNGLNGSSPAANTAGNNAESDVGEAGKSRNEDASGSGTATRAAENKPAQREAALIKFRQKRKERCFKKKVRYQNRKKLAEQRPRVRGQFVKQTGTDSSNGTGDE